MRSVFLLALAARALTAQQTPGTSLLTDAQLKSILAARIDTAEKSVGMVVGIVSPQGRRIVSYGKARKGDTAPPDGNTVFEIGGVTKVFTSLLLTDMVRHREVKLDDPAAKLLP